MSFTQDKITIDRAIIARLQKEVKNIKVLKYEMLPQTMSTLQTILITYSVTCSQCKNIKKSFLPVEYTTDLLSEADYLSSLTIKQLQNIDKNVVSTCGRPICRMKARRNS